MYRLYALRPKKLREIHASLGGKFSYKERLAMDGTGSPFMYYTNGHPEIDTLNERTSDLLRINFEEFKGGLMVGISERTEPYIIPLRPNEIIMIEVALSKEKATPKASSFFNWLLKKNIPLSFARFFSGSGEYSEATTQVFLHTPDHNINCWTTGAEYSSVKKYFQKSQFADKLKIKAL